MPAKAAGVDTRAPGEKGPGRVLVIACGALAHEIVALQRRNDWSHLVVQCLPAEWHNTPDRIPPAVRERIRAARDDFSAVFVAYGDCGTGGRLDRVLADEGVERLPGAHCYQFFAGEELFERLTERELGTFYLTDFLARHFDRIVLRGLGIDRHPELADVYFAHYRKLVYLVQQPDPEVEARARAAAVRLGLEFELQPTGFGQLEPGLVRFVERTWPS